MSKGRESVRHGSLNRGSNDVSRGPIDENLGSIIGAVLRRRKWTGRVSWIFFYRGEVPKKSNDSVGISKSHYLRALSWGEVDERSGAASEVSRTAKRKWRDKSDGR